jgi:hypothetical protein
MSPEIRSYLVEASQTIYANDIVVLVDDSVAQRVKKLSQTEITADYAEGGTTKGLLGIAMHNIVTDANGLVSQLVPSTIADGANAIYPLPSYASGIDRDYTITGGTTPDKGNARLNVMLFNNWTEFLMECALGSNAAVTMTQAYVGLTAAIQIRNTVDFALEVDDNSGTDSPMLITGLMETDPNFGVSATTKNRAFVKLLATHQQGINGALWTT